MQPLCIGDLCKLALKTVLKKKRSHHTFFATYIIMSYSLIITCSLVVLTVLTSISSCSPFVSGHFLSHRSCQRRPLSPASRRSHQRPAVFTVPAGVSPFSPASGHSHQRLADVTVLKALSSVWALSPFSPASSRSHRSHRRPAALTVLGGGEADGPRALSLAGGRSRRHPHRVLAASREPLQRQPAGRRRHRATLLSGLIRERYSPARQ